MNEREDFSGTYMMETRLGLCEVYDCQNDGVPKINRRRRPRGPYNEKAEALFNGFMNAIHNARDPYWKAYITEMRNSFADLMLELQPAPPPRVQVTNEMVLKLRDRSGESMMSCKKALIASAGNMGVAEELVRAMNRKLA